jgi:hypothetical protein
MSWPNIRRREIIWVNLGRTCFLRNVKLESIIHKDNIVLFNYRSE